MLSDFNFGAPTFLWLLLALPLIALIHRYGGGTQAASDRLKDFIDPHLLPHLLRRRSMVQKKTPWPLILWSLAWIFGCLALAGPRWNYTDVEASKPNRSLVIVLDLSKSMDAQDMKPSRLGRAKEEIGDILDMEKGLNVGLVAFAATPHLVVPPTDDMGTIRYLLPSLDTSLITLQGSRLQPALTMAGHMLDAIKGGQKSILVVSDGGFEDTADAMTAIPSGVQVYTLGVGTPEGAPIPAEGGFIKDGSGATVIAKREDGKLRAIANAGHGIAVTADYSDASARALLDHIEGGGASVSTSAGRTVRVWDERFYIAGLLMGLAMLPWFRKGLIVPVVVLALLTATPHPAHAGILDWFRNPDQQAQADYSHGDYSGAAQKFGAPYQKGVAQYKAGQYDKAVQSFDAAKTSGPDAQYNLGNAELLKGDPQSAIDSYNAVLKARPGDKDAARNLAVAKKLLQQQKQQQNKQSSNDKHNQQQQQNQQSGSQGDKNQPQKGGQSQEQSQQQQGQQNQAQNGQQQKPQQQNQQQTQQQNGSSSAQKNSAGQQQPPSSAQQAAQQPNQPKPEQQPNQPPQGQATAQNQPQKPPQNPQPQQQPSGEASQQPKQPQAPQDQTQAQTSPGEPPQPGTPADSKPRQSAQNIDATQWLSRAASDPAPFLKNQFKIDDRQYGTLPEDDQPW
jgi:Ca-activated chloride channel family protein